MLKLTPAAAEQVVKAAQSGGMTHLALRVAVKTKADGSFDYGVGFDDIQDDDLAFKCEGIQVIMAPEYEPMLQGATMDFVEIEPGEPRFIFLNPNDPSYVPPSET